MTESSDIKYKWWLRDILELGILAALIVFMAVIYIPRAIWAEEEDIQEESRFRMETVYDVLTYYGRLTGQKTTNAAWALAVVNAARDSSTADSTFLGTRKIILADGDAQIDMYKGFPSSYDTTFGFLRTRKDTLLDTVLTVVLYNVVESTNDTSFVRPEQIGPYFDDSLFVGIADTTLSSHVEVVSYYESFMPDLSMLYCPLTNRLYIVETGEDQLKVESPIEGSYAEPRFWVFSFRANSHGKIENGEKSWVRF